MIAKRAESITDAECHRRLAAAYNIILQSFDEWARQRLAELEAELQTLGHDPGKWRQRLALRREKRYIYRLLGEDDG